MTTILDKLILFLFCSALFLPTADNLNAVVVLIVALILSSFESYFDTDPVRLLVLVVVVIASMFFPEYTFFLPLFVYPLFRTRFDLFSLIVAIPLILFILQQESTTWFILSLMILLAFFLKIRTSNYEKRLTEYLSLRDEIAEKKLSLESANRDLLEKQDYEIHVATLNERNRIARELHDSIGHVLTSALLQTGAIQTLVQDKEIKEQLDTLQKSLSSGMEQVRTSIHNLHEDSFDLHAELNNMIKDYRFCPVFLTYNLSQTPEKNLRYAILSIVKEALSNVARHSNATEIHISVIEHPAIYQLMIRDNGSVLKGDRAFDPRPADGMGLPGIIKRVETLEGHCVFRVSNGFEVFVSLPKEKK